jgi:pimeloyl-ACP methyl ester carboxylesterase
MYKRSRSDFEPLVPHLSAAGLAVLAFDLRGHGDSTGSAAMKLADRVDQRDPKLFKDMAHDLTAAYEWLRDQSDVDPARFALVGASVGSSIALDYAAQDKSVDVVVCLTPGISYLGINAAEAVAKIGDRPLLLLASQAERAAVDELSRLTPKALTEIVPGPPAGQDQMALHGTRMFTKVPGIEERIAKFLSTSLGEPSTERVVASIKGKVYYPPDSSQARRLSPKNLRWFSSPAEAEGRGLRTPASSSKSRSQAGSPSPGRAQDSPFPDGR